MCCVHVCVYACVYICMHVCACMCVCICMYVCVHACVYMCACVHIYVYMHCICLCLCMCVRMCVHVCMHVCVCACVCAHAHCVLFLAVQLSLLCSSSIWPVLSLGQFSVSSLHMCFFCCHTLICLSRLSNQHHSLHTPDTQCMLGGG